MLSVNRKFRRDYDRFFRREPVTANLFLLLCELADKRGKIRIDTPEPAEELARLMAARFDDPRAYQLPLGKRR